ncbi:hypothetical protein [Anaerotalea alkaliphila]|uniref:Uncharacterized protein n=1 Tax=Anaerotalea alkaliphila TaxID=2662126 RepID=A0A7X5HW18_9FIRM|nr:hypothetical protein [Anaerotalea alkaliphila]NDL67701.1 hypothetical protein [Anaerotalea alkaliphila]
MTALEQLASIGNGFVQSVVDIATFVIDGFMAGFDGILQLYNALLDQQRYMDSMIASAASGTIDGFNVLAYIGAYRYLVGDPVFVYTYGLILIGITWTIYKLCYYIWQMIKGGFTGSTIIKSIFK